MPLPGTRPGSGTRPGDRPSIQPVPKPGDRPGQLPNRPGNGNRPGLGDRPSIQPVPKPGDRPGQLPNRPGNGNRPGLGDRPGQLPNRPGHGNRPGLGDRPGQLPNRPGHGNRPGFGNRPGYGNRPGRPTHPIQRPPFNRPGYGHRPGHGKPWWGHGNKVNIRINNNFRHCVNWSTHHRYWGYNPWWSRPACRPWYGGSWHGGWGPGYHYHYHSWPGYNAGAVIGWGLAAWGLGALIYNIGYNSYQNPYPVQPVPTTTGAPVDYSQPITLVSAETAPTEEGAVEEITEKSESYIEKSQEAFRAKNYVSALDFAGKAVGEAPGDGALHEYRALVLFALGKFGEAAGVLNPVLASGPGWDWTTMVKLYDSQKTYTDQLRKLEQYTTANPKDAACHFLLGYHYMVCGHMDMAKEQFDTASKLQPADSVARQLADLLAVSTTAGDGEASGTGAAPAEPEGKAAEPAAAATPAPEPVPLEKLNGTWVADKGKEGKITLALKDDGKFTWAYAKEKEKPFELDGEYTMDEKGFLVLSANDSQMVASVSLPKENEMKFVLAAGPPGDPGLTFEKN